MMQPDLFEAAEITLESDWTAVTASRECWRRWLEIAKEQARECYEYWSDTSACQELGKCRHLDSDAVWCCLVDYPATVNPVLKETGMLGMACRGAGYEKMEKES